MKIRKETAADIEAVFEINRSAFLTEEEAQLVNLLSPLICTLIIAYCALRIADIKFENAGV